MAQAAAGKFAPARTKVSPQPISLRTCKSAGLMQAAIPFSIVYRSFLAAIVTRIAPRRKQNSRRGKKEVRIPRKIPGERIYKRKKIC